MTILKATVFIDDATMMPALVASDGTTVPATRYAGAVRVSGRDKQSASPVAEWHAALPIRGELRANRVRSAHSASVFRSRGPAGSR